METLMFAALVFISLCQTACLVLLILTARREKRKKPEEQETVNPGEYEDYLEKLWQQGLNGIMSYGIDQAVGKRRSDE